jgi:hypothetical protein
VITPQQKRKFIEQGLPIVSVKTLEALYDVYAGNKWGKHLEEVRERLIQENPNLVKFIENQVGKYPPKLHTPMFEVVLGTISILEHQALIDKQRR